MQAGSDDQTACATCHFHAGQDPRTRNQLSPGRNQLWDAAGHAPNAELAPQHYPFTGFAFEDDGRRIDDPVYDTDNITGSQGVRRSTFTGINAKTGVESFSSAIDPIFNRFRQVGGRNAPSTINAVFNRRNFHDGRAQAEFNGVNPFGNRDAGARVWFVSPVGPTQVDIHIQDASLASQSVGPVLDTKEMSAAGRTFPQVGKKLMRVKPLGLQKVHPADSVLGAYAAAPTGLTTTYKAMIQAAFKSKWWNTTKTLKVGGVTYTMIMTRYDELVIPYTSWVMPGRGVTNIVIQDRCPQDFSEHLSLAFDPNAGRLILNALDPKRAQPLRCVPVLPGWSRPKNPQPPPPPPARAGSPKCSARPPKKACAPWPPRPSTS